MIRTLGPPFFATTTAPVGGVGDTFDRTNSATALGTASDGATWTTADSFWGITGNQAYNPCASGSGPGGSTQAYRNGTGANVYTVTCSISMPASGTENPGILFRVQDNSNFLVAFLDNVTLSVQVYKVVAGAFTNIFGTGSVFSLGTSVLVQVATEGASGGITVTTDGVFRSGSSDTQFMTLTKVGLYTNAPTGTGVARWDNLTVT